MSGDVPEQSPFDPEVLTWRILALLPELESASEFAAVSRYVQGDALRRYELAARLAQLYDEYLVYRADWIATWEREPSPHWQALLWRRLSEAAGVPHRAALHRRLLKALGTKSAPPGLPQRVCVFGAPALPPALLDLFAALGCHGDVHLFVPNPCREYWGDIQREADIARKHLARAPDAAYLESGNALLASLGQQGRDFVDLVSAIDDERIANADHFVEPGRATLLSAVQSDILDLTQSATAAPKAVIAADDVSIQVHSCHSAMREVEVLHDQLLALFSAAPELEPSDVVAMTPDIETYAPYVEAVFGTAEHRIPFNISDRGAEKESSLAATFMALLGLPGSRYDANGVLGILDELSVRRRFGLAEGDLDTVRNWVREAGIRWGIDAAHRTRFGLPATHEHTWRFGLDRLLLGYGLPGGEERLFAGVLPYDEVEGNVGAALGRFAAFAEAAIALDAQLARARSIAQWGEALHRLVTRFFDPPQDRSEELEAVRACVAALTREARAAGHEDAVPLPVMIAALRARLEPPGRAFLSGGVTFCAMVPMRSLPFEVVCMIGMNDRAFPRVRRRDGFDLMAEDFRKGDRSRRDDDRYLFLESLLSARRHLYLSYTGRHIREDTVVPPSVLVSELLDYVERGYVTDDGTPLRERLTTSHPLQSFSRRYFAGDAKLFTYSPALARAAATAGRGERLAQRFLTEALPPPEREARSVDLESLVRFFRNPARYLLQTRLSIRLESADDEIDAREPFALESLPLFRLKERLLDLELRREPHDGLALARAGGVLPHGRMGEVLFEQEAAAIERFAATVAPLVPKNLLDPVHLELRAGEITLTGVLSRVSADGLLDFRPVKASANLRLAAWIRHLALNACAPRGAGLTSRCVTQECVLTFAPVADARQRLEELLALYWSGLQEPLRFFPRTSAAYVEAGEVSYPVRQTWFGSGRGDSGERPESDDPYYALAFRGVDPLDEAFEAIARTVLAPLQGAVSETPLA